MTPEERELLDKTYQLTAENNDILRRLYRSHTWGRYAKIAYWGVIIFLSVGAYWLIQPYVNQLMAISGSAGQAVQNLHNATSNIEGLLQ